MSVGHRNYVVQISPHTHLNNLPTMDYSEDRLEQFEKVSSDLIKPSPAYSHEEHDRQMELEEEQKAYTQSKIAENKVIFEVMSNPELQRKIENRQGNNNN